MKNISVNINRDTPLFTASFPRRVIKNRIIPRILSILIVIAAMLPLCTVPSFSKSDSASTVRVGFPIQMGLTFFDENNTPSGYTCDYLDEVAQYTGWNYEYVAVDGDINTQLYTLFDMLERGEIDLMGAMTYDDAYISKFNYSAYSYGTASTLLQTFNNDEEPFVVDSRKKQTLRVALYANSPKSLDKLNSFCDINQIDLIPVMCQTQDELIQALSDGRADVILNSSANMIPNMQTIASFAPAAFYFATAKDKNADLMGELETAIYNITTTNPYLQQNLFKSHFSDDNSRLSLTSEEIKEIKLLGTLNVSIMDNQMPYQDYNAGTGVFSGICPDLLNYISEITGLKFNFVHVSNSAELTRLISEGKIDIIGSVPRGMPNAVHISMSQPFLSSTYALVSNETFKRGNTESQRLAARKNSAYPFSENEYADYYTSNLDILDAIAHGDADYAYMNSLVAQYYLSEPKYSRLKITPQINSPYHSCFALTNREQPTLLNIINKAILSISSDTIQSIVYDNAAQAADFSFAGWYNARPGITLAIIGGVFLIILILILIILRVRIKSSKIISIELQKHLKMCAYSNDFLFEYTFGNHMLKYNNNVSDAAHPHIESISFLSSANNGSPDDGQGSDIVRNALLAIFTPSANGTHEIYGECIDGKTHWLRIVVETVCNASGAPIYSIGKMTIIDDEKQQELDLIDRAERDSLTRLYNSAKAQAITTDCLTRLKNYETGGFIILDIDFFKFINDTYGHTRGNEVLIAFAELLRAAFDEDTVIARIGGDEFSIYFPTLDGIADLNEKCNLLFKYVSDLRLYDETTMTVSAGAVISRCGDSYSELFSAADRALYDVKRAGKNDFKILSSAK